MVFSLFARANKKLQNFEERASDVKEKQSEYHLSIVLAISTGIALTSVKDSDSSEIKPFINIDSSNFASVISAFEKRLITLEKNNKKKDSFDASEAIEHWDKKKIPQLLEEIPATFPIDIAQEFLSEKNRQHILCAASGPGYGKSLLSEVILYLALKNNKNVSVIKPNIISQDRKIDPNKTQKVLNAINCQNQKQIRLMVIDDDAVDLLDNSNPYIEENIEQIKGMTKNERNICYVIINTNHPDRMSKFLSDRAVQSRTFCFNQAKNLLEEGARRYLIFLILLRRLYCKLEQDVSTMSAAINEIFHAGTFEKLEKSLSFLSLNHYPGFELDYRMIIKQNNEYYFNNETETQNVFTYLSNYLTEKVKQEFKKLSNIIISINREKNTNFDPQIIIGQYINSQNDLKNIEKFTKQISDIPDMKIKFHKTNFQKFKKSKSEKSKSVGKSPIIESSGNLQELNAKNLVEAVQEKKVSRYLSTNPEISDDGAREILIQIAKIENSFSIVKLDQAHINKNVINFDISNFLMSSYNFIIEKNKSSGYKAKLDEIIIFVIYSSIHKKSNFITKSVTKENLKENIKCFFSIPK